MEVLKIPRRILDCRKIGASTEGRPVRSFYQEKTRKDSQLAKWAGKSFNSYVTDDFILPSNSPAWAWLASPPFFQTFSSVLKFPSPFLSPYFGQHCLLLHKENEGSQKEAPSNPPSIWHLHTFLPTVIVILPPSLSNFSPLFQQFLLHLDAFAHTTRSETRVPCPLCLLI